MVASPGVRVDVRALCGPDEAREVRHVAAGAADSDGVAPLSEHSLLHLLTDGSTHLLAREGDELVGYAQVWAGGAAELVVTPKARRQGVGTALWHRARRSGADRVWAHGDLPAASALAARAGLVRVRELHKMARPLSATDVDIADLPGWVQVQTFADRNDPAEWVALNAAAFAGHPEQGALTVEDFAARAAEPWFDPEDLLYLLDVGSPKDAAPIAFHWTKRASEDTGETYAVGIHPAYQGRGLAGPLTRLGLAHLARRGASEVDLYVDGDNERALRTYRRAGFRTIMVDVVHAVPDGQVDARTVRMEP